MRWSHSNLLKVEGVLIKRLCFRIFYFLLWPLFLVDVCEAHQRLNQMNALNPEPLLLNPQRIFDNGLNIPHALSSAVKAEKRTKIEIRNIVRFLWVRCFQAVRGYDTPLSNLTVSVIEEFRTGISPP